MTEDLESGLIDYLEGELPEEEARRIRALVERDPEARRLLDQIRSALAAAAEPAQAAPPPGWNEWFYGRVRARMREEGLDPAAPAGRASGRWVRGLFAGSPVRGLAWIAAAVLAVNLVAWSTLWLLRPAGRPEGVELADGSAGEDAADTETTDPLGFELPDLTDAQAEAVDDRLRAELAAGLAAADLDVLAPGGGEDDDYLGEMEGLTPEEAEALARTIDTLLPATDRSRRG
jgi:anti-sigma-K factor RskA